MNCHFAHLKAGWTEKNSFFPLIHKWQQIISPFMDMPGQKLPGMSHDELQMILSGIFWPFGMVHRRGEECFSTQVTLSTSQTQVAKSNLLGGKAPSRSEISGMIFLHFEGTMAFCLTSHHFYLSSLQNQSTHPLKFWYSTINFQLHLNSSQLPGILGTGDSCLGCDQVCWVLKSISKQWLVLWKVCLFPFIISACTWEVPF